MQIVFNGESVQLTAQCDLLELLERKLGETHASLENVVVAVNQDFVHRQDYADFKVSEGDNIEMLSAVVGG
ncbi:MAG: sulfur carrier protein ThiS [Bermanella sp.]